MSQSLELPPAGFEALSIEEQIAYVQALWDHIAAIASGFQYRIGIARF
jgi:hypothetical protein